MSTGTTSLNPMNVYTALLEYMNNEPRNFTYIGLNTAPFALPTGAENLPTEQYEELFNDLQFDDHIIPSFILDIYKSTSQTIRLVNIDPRFAKLTPFLQQYFKYNRWNSLKFNYDIQKTSNEGCWQICRSEDNRIQILILAESFRYANVPSTVSPATIHSNGNDDDEWVFEKLIEYTIPRFTCTTMNIGSRQLEATTNNIPALVVQEYSNTPDQNDDRLMDCYKKIYTKHPQKDILKHRVYFDNTYGTAACITERFYNSLSSPSQIMMTNSSSSSIDSTSSSNTNTEPSLLFSSSSSSSSSTLSSSTSSSSSSTTSATLSIQYISDIHLELMEPYNNQDFRELFRPHGEVLVLAGDIGNPYLPSYQSFLEWVSPQFPIIFIIAGNHEFYRNEILPGKEKIKDVVKPFLNIIYLDNSFFDWKGLRFIGSIQWTKVKNPAYTINDTRVIRNFTPQDYDNLHTVAKDYISTEITRSPLPVIVITHHVPLYELTHPKYRLPAYEKYNQWFSADLDEIVQSHAKKIRGWIYGHTHTATVLTLYNVPFYCNPLGYIGENEWDTNINQICEISTVPIIT